MDDYAVGNSFCDACNICCYKRPYERRMRTYTLKLLALTAIILGAMFVAFWKFYNIMPPPSSHIIVAFFVMAGYYGYYLMLRAAQKNNRQFVTQFMAIFGGKFILSIILLALLIYLDQPNKNLTAIVFGGCYLIFTVFEVVEMLKILKATSNDNTN